MFSPEVQQAWKEAYGQPNGDPHSVFAQKLGMSRNEAKRLCYVYMYSEDNLFAGQAVKYKDGEFNFLLNLFNKVAKTRMTKEQVLEAYSIHEQTEWSTHE